MFIPHQTDVGVSATVRPTLADLSSLLTSGEVTSRMLVERCLQRIADRDGQGDRVFRSVLAHSALRVADAMDILRSAGAEPSPFAGIPISVKDLFDIAGQPTPAGSNMLQTAIAAEQDAEGVARLRRAGFVVVGRTNMTEFAFSGLGINPHFGTPLNPWDRKRGRIPGGSSSGAAISVTDGMAHAALGTDTGGSCRIPAAFTGLVGFKPTARRVPLGGTLPLSPSLDSVGTLARSVACCASLDSVLAAEPIIRPVSALLDGLRFLVPTNVVLDDLDDHTALTFRSALSRLSGAGAVIIERPLPQISQIGPLNGKGGFTAAEAYAWHRELLAAREEEYDPRVSIRIKRGASQDAADYIALVDGRRRLVAETEVAAAGYDAILMPTVPLVAPFLDELRDDEAYTRANLLALRNPTVFNFLDGCAISLPMQEAGTLPVGLMIGHLAGHDRRVISIAQAVEEKLSNRV